MRRYCSCSCLRGSTLEPVYTCPAQLSFSFFRGAQPIYLKTAVSQGLVAQLPETPSHSCFLLRQPRRRPPARPPPPLPAAAMEALHEEMPFDLDFHPSSPLVVTSLITGDLCLYALPTARTLNPIPPPSFPFQFACSYYRHRLTASNLVGFTGSATARSLRLRGTHGSSVAAPACSVNFTLRILPCGARRCVALLIASVSHTLSNKDGLGLCDLK